MDRTVAVTMAARHEARLQNCRNHDELNRVVAALALTWSPNEYKNIVDLCWMEVASKVRAGNPEYSRLLTVAAEQWQAIELDNTEAPQDGCDCHLLRGETCRKCLVRLQLQEATVRERHPIQEAPRTMREAAMQKQQRLAAQYGMGTEKLAAMARKDPDGPPHGAFRLQVSEEMNAKAIARLAKRQAWSASMAFIHAPDKNLRDELRSGVYYEDRT